MSDVARVLQECLKETNQGISELSVLQRALMFNLNVTDDQKCLASCAAKKANFVQNGKINEKFSLDIGGSTTSIDFEQCQTITGTNECDTNYKLVQCGVARYLKKEGALG
ncbi:hypothetical protein Trydic_g20675 [Trypoxylus dichotomus]